MTFSRCPGVGNLTLAPLKCQIPLGLPATPPPPPPWGLTLIVALLSSPPPAGTNKLTSSPPHTRLRPTGWAPHSRELTNQVSVDFKCFPSWRTSQLRLVDGAQLISSEKKWRRPKLQVGRLCKF